MIVASFILGIFGSLHCVGMCGPLIIMLQGKQSSDDLLSPVSYHAGRIAVYAVLGLIMSIIGKGSDFFGFQQNLALILGVTMILFVLISSNPEQKLYQILGIKGMSNWIREKYAQTLNKSSLQSKFLLGALNGILPCGLVYSAMLMTIGAHSFAESIGIMVAFGVGTLPALIAVKWFSQFFKIKWNKVFQYSMIFAGLLMILRGANLDIPYISPNFEIEAGSDVPSCH